MKTEEDEVDTDAGVSTETEDATVETEEEVAEDAGAEEAGKTIEKEELPKDAPEWAVKRIGKLTAKRHEAETAREAAERERDEYKAQAEKATAKYGDRDILEAARRTGILPELMSGDEAKTLTRADQLETNIDRLEQAVIDYPEGYEDENGKTVTPQQLNTWLRSARKELKEIGDDAAALRKAKATEFRELIKLGRDAKRAGWKPGEKPKTEAGGRRTEGGVTPPVKAKVTGTAVAGAAGVRRPATQATGTGATDFSKVTSMDDFVKQLEKQRGG